MPNSKDSFLDRLKYLEKSFNQNSLIDRSTTYSDHNNIAKLLRNGMAVIGFVSLEDFIKKRTSEALVEIGTFSINFSDLPLSVRYKTTVDALHSIIRLVKFEETKADKILFVQNHTAKISSTLNTSFDLIEIAFGNSSSNIDGDEIKKILKSFYIHDPWQQMTSISNRLGLTSFSLENSFKNASIRRHNAAHEAYANTPLLDLTQFIKEALGIAIGFDCLISKALWFLKNHDSNYISGNKIISYADIEISTIKKERNLWKYKKLGANRAIKNEVDRSILIPFAISLANRNNETIIIFDENNSVENWYCF